MGHVRTLNYGQENENAKKIYPQKCCILNPSHKENQTKVNTIYRHLPTAILPMMEQFPTEVCTTGIASASSPSKTLYQIENGISLSNQCSSTN